MDWRNGRKSKSKNRIDYIRNLKASVRFISCEPLLEDLGELDLSGINWIIVGGESGVQARPMKEEWVLNIKRQADKNNIPFSSNNGEHGVLMESKGIKKSMANCYKGK